MNDLIRLMDFARKAVGVVVFLSLLLQGWLHVLHESGYTFSDFSKWVSEQGELIKRTKIVGVFRLRKRPSFSLPRFKLYQGDISITWSYVEDLRNPWWYYWCKCLKLM